MEGVIVSKFDTLFWDLPAGTEETPLQLQNIRSPGPEWFLRVRTRRFVCASSLCSKRLIFTGYDIVVSARLGLRRLGLRAHARVTLSRVSSRYLDVRVILGALALSECPESRGWTRYFHLRSSKLLLRSSEGKKTADSAAVCEHARVSGGSSAAPSYLTSQVSPLRSKSELSAAVLWL